MGSSVPIGQNNFAAVYGKGSNQLIVATGSPGELGLLKVIAEEFSKDNDVSVLWRKAGTGESLQFLRDRKADVIMVHGPAAEKKAISEGWAACRTLVGSNEFFLVGPPDDPAQVGTARSIVKAYARIAKSGGKFFSRSDNSGTHQKEMAVWQKAGITPAGDWCIRTHDYMMATLLRADVERGYFMTDSSTWVAGRDRTPNLKVLFKGDPFIVNVYHAYCQPAGATPQSAMAAKFVDFLASERGQKIIREFGKDQYQEGLYNDANYARQFE